MPVRVAWESDPSQIVVFDATPSELHDGSSTATSFPIEGSSGSDHITREPDQLSLTGIVSNDPINAEDDLPASTGGSSINRAESAYAFVREAKDNGRLVRVFTSLRDYRSMAILSLKVQRDSGGSNVVNMQITLKEIITSKTRQVEAPTPAKSTAPARNRKKSKGKTPTTEESAKNAEKAEKAKASGNSTQAHKIGGNRVRGFFN